MIRPAVVKFALAAVLLTGGVGAGVNLAGSSGAADAGEPPLRFVLNVPAHRLYVYENGEPTRTYRVSVGLPGNQTPAGEYAVSSLIWNPWWHPPNSNWARGRKVESPGPANPMGRVKLNFAPLLYIHGTVERSALGDPASRGCVRMSNDDLIELTRLVHQYLLPSVPESTVETLVNSPTKTTTFHLPRKIPFEVVYSVVAVRNGFLYVYPDIYGRVKDYQKQVENVLAAEGIDAGAVDWARLDELMEKGRTAKVAISVDELTRGGRGAGTR